MAMPKMKPSARYSGVKEKLKGGKPAAPAAGGLAAYLASKKK